MIVDGFRSSLQSYSEAIAQGAIDAGLLASMDRKLCDVANHIAFCHRNYVEKMAEANTLTAWVSGRRAHLLREAARVDVMLEATLELQDQLIALRSELLVQLFERIYEQMGI